MLAPLKQSEVWFVTGSQHLYGPETLRQVADNSRTIAEALDRSPRIPCRVVFKPVVKTPEEVPGLLGEANASPACVGLILWMHTFSPAKMWIAGPHARCASRSRTSTRSSTATCRGERSTWTS